MTLQEQIEQASVEYQIKKSPRVIAGDAFADMAFCINKNKDFIAGAEYGYKLAVEKACEWFKANAYSSPDGSRVFFNRGLNEFIHDFKRVMKNERI